MAKTKTTIYKNIKEESFEKPASILSEMKSLKAELSETSDEETKVLIQLHLNALSKAFYKLLSESFECSDDIIEELIKAKVLPDTGYSVSINNVLYTYSKEQVSKAEIDKAYLTSEGVKTLKALYEKWESNGIAIPACIDKSVKTIVSFKPELWNKEPFAQLVTSDVINIDEKDTNLKKVK